MKAFTAVAVAVGLLLGVTINAKASEGLAKKNNCLSCHTVDNKVIGPSYKEVAAKYKGKNAEAALVEKVKQGGAGVWGAVPMPSTSVSDADAKALVKWILSR